MVRVSGGLTHFGLFNQIQADMYGRLVVRPAETEATALGAWISAAVRMGLYSGYADAYGAAESASIAAGRDETEYEPSPLSSSICAGMRRKKKLLYEALEASGIFGMA